MAIDAPLPALPKDSVPVVDPATGLINPDWFRFFLALVAMLKEIKAEVP